MGSSGALPAKLPDKLLALAFEVVGALSGVLAGSAFAVKELYAAAYAQLRQVLRLQKKKLA